MAKLQIAKLSLHGRLSIADAIAPLSIVPSEDFPIAHYQS
jgi:hypothetical protein